MKEAAYNKIARYYDGVIGKEFDADNYLKKQIKRYNKDAKSILEFGCGTGNNLKAFIKNYDLTGIDISEEMLKIARKKILNCNFIVQDIRTFKSDKRFDLIICLYDTLNHLLLFNEWKKLFVNAYNHLNNEGLLIFDVNTIYKLDYLSAISPIVHKFESNYLIVSIKKTLRNTFNWNLKVFENKKMNEFTLVENNIEESSFETDRITNELAKYFIIRRIEDEDEKKIRTDTARVFFVCQKIVSD